MSGVRIVGGRLPFATQDQVDRAAIAAVREGAAVGASLVKEVLLSARDERGFVGRKDTGMAHQAVGSSEPVLVGPGLIRATTGMGPPRDGISVVLEEGRRPGARPPPSEALKPWVRRKLANAIAAELRGARVTTKAAARFRLQAERILKKGGTLARGAGPKVSGVKKAEVEKAVERVAFAVARSIGRKGFPGLHAFRRAADVLQKRIEGIFLRHLRRELAGGRPA